MSLLLNSLLLLLIFLSQTTSYSFQTTPSRRDLINQALSSSLAVAASTWKPSAATAIPKGGDGGGAMESFSVYKVIPDASEQLAPSIEVVKPKEFRSRVAQVMPMQLKNKMGGVIWLGEHHNSKRDHNLQADIIQSIHDTRNKKLKGKGSVPPMAIGLEQIQVQFQPVLDAYVMGDISEEEMLQGVQWEKRWTWSYENYRPIFQMARELKISLVALNVNSEDLAAVEVNGIQGLSRDQVRKYIKDPVGFGEFAKPAAYKSYVSYVIEPSYDLHKNMGLLKTTMSGEPLEETMSFGNFFGGRILWDESMAGNAFRWCEKNPSGLMIGLVGADHVKFEKGVNGRYASLAKGRRETISVLLNPTLIDTRPSGSVSNYINADSSSYPDQITLQLRYLKDGVSFSSQDRSLPENTGGVLPLADYIVISNTV